MDGPASRSYYSRYGQRDYIYSNAEGELLISPAYLKKALEAFEEKASRLNLEHPDNKDYSDILEFLRNRSAETQELAS